MKNALSHSKLCRKLELQGTIGNHTDWKMVYILSVTLFIIKICKLVKNLNPGIDSSLYVDDYLNMLLIKTCITQQKLQLDSKKINKWTKENGFKFSQTNMKCKHFCNLYRMHNDPCLKLNGKNMPITDQYKFLGIIFDKRLSFINLLWVIAITDWRGDRKSQLKLDWTMVWSKLAYGGFIYGATRPTNFKKLETIHHQWLSLTLGAFGISPVESLYIEANETPQSLRRQKLALRNITKLSSCPLNPANDCIFKTWYKNPYLRKVQHY